MQAVYVYLFKLESSGFDTRCVVDTISHIMRKFPSISEAEATMALQQWTVNRHQLMPWMYGRELEALESRK